MEESNTASNGAPSLEERSTLLATWRSERFDPSVTQNTDMPPDTLETLDQTMAAAMKVMKRDRKSKIKDPDVGPWAEQTLIDITDMMTEIDKRIMSDAHSGSTVDPTDWEALKDKRDKLIRQIEKGPEKKPKSGVRRRSTLLPETQPSVDGFAPKPPSRSFTTRSVTTSASQHGFLTLFGGAIMPKLASSSTSSKPKPKPKPEPKPESPKKTGQYWERKKKPSSKNQSASDGKP